MQLEAGPGPRSVAMIVMGFPSPDKPVSGIFNQRAAKALNDLVPVSVIYLRTWKPGRRREETSVVEGIPVTTVTVPQVPRASLTNIALYRSLGWSRVRSIVESCDLIHSVDGAFGGILGSDWAQRGGKHHVTQIIGSDVNSLLPRMKGKAAVSGWESYLHGVACNSQALASEFLKLYPAAVNVRVVRRGVNLERYHPAGPSAGPLCANPPVRYLYLGGFATYPRLPHGINTKGGMTLLAAWKQAEERLIAAGASLLIAGPGADLPPVTVWRGTLRDPSRVFLAGTLSPEVVARHVRSADAVLIPSLEEGLPNVAMEASACGRPVLASDVGGLPEVVADGETGVLLPPGDEPAWSDALARFAGAPGALARMGQRSRIRMEALFDSASYATQMFGLFRSAFLERL